MTREVGMLIKQSQCIRRHYIVMRHYDIRLARLLSDNVRFLIMARFVQKALLPILPYEKRIQISTVFKEHNDDRWPVSSLMT